MELTSFDAFPRKNGAGLAIKTKSLMFQKSLKMKRETDTSSLRWQMSRGDKETESRNEDLIRSLSCSFSWKP